MSTNSEITVAIGLSGGVDSALTAYMLKEQGYNVLGLTMKIWDGTIPIKDEGRTGCFGPGEEQDIEVAQKICGELKVPYHVIDLANEYKASVLEYFRAEYLAGRTPNPCVRCNHTMKFGMLLEKARAAGISFDYFATGHYARIKYDQAGGRYLLLKARDQTKDQTYFLSFLTQQQLARLMFPLGELNKSEVKARAKAIGWNFLAEKPESQDFIETSNYGVLFKAGELKPGAIVDQAGQRIGTHNGIVHYTVGQRKGLGGGSSEPQYVTAIDGPSNLVRIGPKSKLYSAALFAEQLNWFALPAAPQTPLSVSVKIRQQHKECRAAVRKAEHQGRSGALIEFAEPQLSVTPGQAVALYQEETLIGSGIISCGFESLSG